ncbi:MAG: archaetidylserine decarboxylase [Hyphomicrobiaceae bacterium]|jgi:phosphatidylserine decarboxylase
MTVRSAIARLTDHEGLNFLLTNRVPRRALTRFVGRFSRIEQPLVRDLSIAMWRLFCDVDLSDARKSSFASMRDCFTRELREGARPIDPDHGVLVSPCDAIVGAAGTVVENELLQVKGAPYTLEELLCDAELAALYRNGRYATLRLTAGMYHRFHAPFDCRVDQVTHIAGDAWNVNPSALKRVEKIYCKNERAVLRLDLGGGQIVTLVAVAAILVADVRLRFLDIPVEGRDRNWTAHPAAQLAKGEEMGWFEQGSTIIALAPDGFSLCDTIQPGHRIRMGEPLLLRP